MVRPAQPFHKTPSLTSESHALQTPRLSRLQNRTRTEILNLRLAILPVTLVIDRIGPPRYPFIIATPRLRPQNFHVPSEISHVLLPLDIALQQPQDPPSQIGVGVFQLLDHALGDGVALLVVDADARLLGGEVKLFLFELVDCFFVPLVAGAVDGALAAALVFALFDFAAEGGDGAGGEEEGEQAAGGGDVLFRQRGE